MTRRVMLWLGAAMLLVPLTSVGQVAGDAGNPHLVRYEGSGGGPGAGRHIVFIAGDHDLVVRAVDRHRITRLAVQPRAEDPPTD